MLDREYVQLMAQYNLFMNEKLYALCASLSEEERQRDRGAFFQSIHGTLSHLVWADRAFLIRLLRWDLPLGQPSDITFPEFEGLRAERARFDRIIVDWAEALDEGALAQPLEIVSVVYKKRRRMPTYLFVVQMFNHQTHHRGQLTTLLSQLGIDPGITDVPFMPFASALVTDLPI
ncbi:MAG: hypothetical protein RL701_1061 [Pseudomonadota bacterium]|jgi:uncharacterized damage-inducible protein DinB